MFKNRKESHLIRPLEWGILGDGQNVCYGQHLLGALIPVLGLSLTLPKVASVKGHLWL